MRCARSICGNICARRTSSGTGSARSER
jgi:hypothetical protein